METLEERARAFATDAHERVGQKRKYTNEPYIHHPAAVVELVRSVPHTEEQIAAGWLHDTVEDTDVVIEDIYDRFGTVVGDYVSFLTDTSKPSDGTRAQRKAIERDRLYKAPPPVKTVKLADLIDNGENILERDPDFAQVYLLEKGLMLEVLREGDSTLWQRAADIVSGSQHKQAATNKALREGSRELIQALKGMSVRGDQKQVDRYSRAVDKVARALGLEPYTDNVKGGKS